MRWLDTGFGVCMGIVIMVVYNSWGCRKGFRDNACKTLITVPGPKYEDCINVSSFYYHN